MHGALEMFLTVKDVVTPDELRLVHEWLSTAQFVNGKASAGDKIRNIKHNLQFDRDAGEPLDVDKIILNGLWRSERLVDALLPKHFLLPIFSKYEPGMAYDWHVDGALMGEERLMRTDVSITVFLNNPDEYDGGELAIQTMVGTAQLKLPAGHAVAYESTTLHRVQQVTRGVRMVAITWLQSFVPDGAMREILNDIAVVRDRIGQMAPQSTEMALLTKTYANLLRQAADA